MPTWVVMAFAGGFLSNLAFFVTRKALKEEDPTAFGWWFEVMRLAAFSALAWFNFKLELSPAAFFWLAALGVTEIAAMYSFAKMQSLTELSVASIVSRLRLVWVPLIALAVLGERLAVSEYLGIALLFLGLSVVASPRRIRNDSGIKYALFFSVTAAVNSVLMKRGAAFASTPVLLAAMSLPAILAFPALMKSSKIRIAASFKKRIKANLAFNVVSMYLFVEALRVGPASKVVGFYQSMLIIAVILGIVVLKERERIVKKVAGSLLTLVAIWLLV